MASVKSLLPNCGLYKTSKPLPEHESEVPAGILVYFHNHSDSGLPVLLTPDHNVKNAWHFHGKGDGSEVFAFRGLSYAETLVRVPEQGFYMLRKDVAFDGGSWPKGTLVQLGYTRQAEPILFIGQIRAGDEQNVLFFSERGVKIQPSLFPSLEPLRVFEEEGRDDGGVSH